MPRLNRYIGRWIRHGDWYPDEKLRLFEKARAQCVGEEPHDRIEVDGPTQRFSGPLRHYSYEDLASQIDSLNRFSSIAAGVWREERRPFRWADLLLRPPWRFTRGYILRGGFLDGWRGLTIALTSAYAVHMKYAKLREAYLREEVRGQGRAE
jgi:hypothetical protein